MKEIQMYKPLKKFLIKKGYTVHSEVESVDVMAQKGGELLIIEMKTIYTPVRIITMDMNFNLLPLLGKI